MLVRVGKRAGFCMGVRRALDKALEATTDHEGHIFTYGPLIHNTQVVELLKRRKVEIIEKSEDVRPGDLVVIRAHGVPPEKLEAIKRAGGNICDATCPHVKRAQETVKKAVAAGARVIIVGDRGHAEVAGLLGYAGGNGIVIESLAEVAGLPPMEFAWVVAQTTQSGENFNEIAAAVKARVPRVEVTRTICGSTSSRQEEVVELATEVDVMVVVGGKHSANTVRLAEIAQRAGVPTVHVETSDELDPSQLSRYRVAGVTAGASTPNWIMEEVVEKLKAIGPGNPAWAGVKGLMSFLLESYLFLAGGAVAISAAACSIAGIPARTTALLVAGLYLLAMQNLNLHLEYRGGELVPHGRRRLYDRFGYLLAPCAAIAAVASLSLALALGRWPFLILALSSLLGCLYTVRLLPARWRYQRLKDLPGSKNVFFAGAIGVVCVLVPAAAQDMLLAPEGSLGLAFAYAMVLAFARSVIFDLKDTQSDQFAGRETIPVFFGPGPTKVVIAGLIACCGALFGLFALVGLVAPGTLWHLIALAYVGIALALHHRGVLTGGMPFELAVDGSFYVPAAIALLA